MSGRNPFGSTGGEWPDDGSGWHEPEHLGRGSGSPPPAGGPAGSVPAEQPAERVDDVHRAQRPADDGRRPVGFPRGELGRVFQYQGDWIGAQAWAVQHGWSFSDGSAPEDAALAELIATAPASRIGRDSRPASVLRGRYGTLELVAFDVVAPMGRGLVPQYAVTAAPLLTAVPTFRLSPARFWKHRTGGLQLLPSGNAEFDGRWVLLTAQDAPSVRAMAADPTVQGLLLGSDDGDEFWSAAVRGGGGAGHFIAGIRPDGHRPELLEHHGRLLTAIVSALMSAV